MITRAATNAKPRPGSLGWVGPRGKDGQVPPLRVFFGPLGHQIIRQVYADRLKTWADWQDLSVEAHGELRSRDLLTGALSIVPPSVGRNGPASMRRAACADHENTVPARNPMRHAVRMHYCQSCDEPVAMEPRGGRAVCPQCGSTASRAGDAVVLRPLFVVTGASGAGKTAVVAPLTRKLRGRCVTFDVDFTMDGESPLSDSRWLAIAHCIAQSGLPTVLLGPIIPESLDELAGRRWISDIHVTLLDCPDELRRARINARPPWQQANDTEKQVSFGRWLRSNIADRVDTSRGSPEEAAAAIAARVGRHLTHDGGDR